MLVVCCEQRNSKPLASNLKTLHMFQLTLQGSRTPLRAVAGEQGAVHRTNGWVFACRSLEEAQEWVRVVNSTVERMTNTVAHSSDAPMYLTMKVGVPVCVCGGQ